jgi:hypothetical protein
MYFGESDELRRKIILSPKHSHEIEKLANNPVVIS